MISTSGLLSTRSAGNGPAVLWLHGYAMDSTIWRPLWKLLPGWRHVGVDLPGHGLSGPIPPGLTLPHLADELAGVARREGARRVVALSFGSLAAVQFALDHPELVDCLVLAAPTLGGAPPDPLAQRRYQELLALYRLVGVGEALVDRWMQSPPDIFRGTERHPALRAMLRTICLRHSWAELGDGAMSVLNGHAHAPADLGAIAADTLVLVGAQDMPAFVGNAALLDRCVPASRVVEVQQAGHLPLLERPEMVAGHLAEHLAGHPAAPPDRPTRPPRQAGPVLSTDTTP